VVVEQQQFTGAQQDAALDAVELEPVTSEVRSFISDRGELHAAKEARLGRRGQC
jgi:hypothetical protein